MPASLSDHAHPRLISTPSGPPTTGHVGEGEVTRTEACGGVSVSWATHLWQPEQLVALLPAAGLRLVTELRIPANGLVRPGVVLRASRPD